MKNATRRFGFYSVLLLGLTLGLVTDAEAEVRLPGFFADHMVLQQQTPLRIWGWADDGEMVTVNFGEQSATATADEAGRWQVELPPMSASTTPMKLTAAGSNSIEINDVLIGEVWLCSGQSNMEWTVQRSTNAENEIASATYPMIRHIKIAHRPSPVPLDDVASEWQVCGQKRSPTLQPPDTSWRDIFTMN